MSGLLENNAIKLNTLKRIASAALLGLFMILATTVGGAQNNRNDQRRDRKTEKRQEQARKNTERREDRTIRADQRRELTRIRNINRNDSNYNNRYRINRNGSYYQTSHRGAELLRQAVNAGYQEGYRAGRNDHNRRRAQNYASSSVYRRGNYGYQSYVNSGQYQYYFQQGFQRGYQDGYNQRYDYGTNNNGSLNIFANILDTIISVELF